MNKIKDFWVRSYTSDPTAFVFEMASFILNVYASLALALTAVDPNLRLIYPAYVVGAVFAVIACYRRSLAWPLLMTGYFAAVNFLGLGVAWGWW